MFIDSRVKSSTHLQPQPGSIFHFYKDVKFSTQSIVHRENSKTKDSNNLFFPRRSRLKHRKKGVPTVNTTTNTNTNTNTNQICIIRIIRHADDGVHYKVPLLSQPIDPSLTQKGKQQCKEIAQKYMASNLRPSIIITSPFRRCVETGQELLKFYSKINDQTENGTSIPSSNIQTQMDENLSRCIPLPQVESTIEFMERGWLPRTLPLMENSQIFEHRVILYLESLCNKLELELKKRHNQNKEKEKKEKREKKKDKHSNLQHTFEVWLLTHSSVVSKIIRLCEKRSARNLNLKFLTSYDISLEKLKKVLKSYRHVTH